MTQKELCLGGSLCSCINDEEMFPDIVQLQPGETGTTTEATIDKAASVGIDGFKPKKYAEFPGKRTYEIDDEGKRKINWVHRIVKPANVKPADWRLSANDVGLRAAQMNIAPEELQRRIDKSKGDPLMQGSVEDKSDLVNPNPYAKEHGEEEKPEEVRKRQSKTGSSELRHRFSID